MFDISFVFTETFHYYYYFSFSLTVSQSHSLNMTSYNNFSFSEKTDMLLVYSQSNRNDKQAAEMYRNKYPNRKQPVAGYFSIICEHLGDTGRLPPSIGLYWYQDLYPSDYMKRLEYLEQISDLLDTDSNALSNILWTSECRFFSNAVVNKHDCFYHTSVNPSWINATNTQGVCCIQRIISDFLSKNKMVSLLFFFLFHRNICSECLVWTDWQSFTWTTFF